VPRVRVRPTGDSTHDLSLTDGKRTVGIKLKDGAAGIVESPATPSTVKINTAQGKYGDYDPSFANIEQRDWSGGRGLENFVDDPSRYYDGTAWTLTPDVLLSALQWHLTSGTIPWNADLPGSVTWKSLVGDDRFLARSFAPTTTYNSSANYHWLRRVGSPGPLTIATYASAASTSPGSATATQTINATAITNDTPSVFFGSTYSSVAMTSGNTYWSILSGNSSDTSRDHWEVGCAPTSGGRASSNGSAWTTVAYYPYHLTLGQPLDKKWHFFAISTLPGTSLVLHAVSQDNSTLDPSSTIRLTATGAWTTVAWTTALTAVVTDVTAIDNQAWFGRRSTGAAGGATSVYRVETSGTTNRGSPDPATTAIGDFVHGFYDPVDGPQLYRGVSTASMIFRASTVGFGTTATWKPSTGIRIGDAGFPIVDIEDYDNQIYVRKQDSLWAVKNDRAAKINVGLDDMPSTALYVPTLAKELYYYLGWSYSLERLYGGTLDDIGPWRGAGMPQARQGVVSCLTGVIGWLFAGIDAGTTGVSSVLAWDGRGWHEVFRAPVAGWRVQNIYFWSPPGVRPRLFVSCGGMIFSISFPRRSLHPHRDNVEDVGTPLTFQHESVLETGTIDMGAAGLEKLFQEVQSRSKGLNSTGTEVRVDYTVDENIGGSTWIEIGAWRQSPSDELSIRQGNKKAIRLRSRMNTAQSSSPVQVSATILKAAARTPIKRHFSVRAKAGSFQVDLQGSADNSPDDFYAFWQDSAVLTKPLHLRSRWKALDDIWVYAEPPVVRRTYRTPSGEWGGEFDIQFREL